MRNNNNHLKNDKKRGFLGRLLVFLLSLLALLGLAAMTMSVLSSYVDPVKFVWFSFFGLAFWAILLGNLIVLVLLMLLWSRKAWISVIALLISLPGIYKSFSTGKAQSGGELRVMSYNVLNFRDPDDQERPIAEVAEGVAKLVRENNPDVLCLQEFTAFMPGKGLYDNISGFGEMVAMPYQRYNTKANFCANVIFSKYPVTPVEQDSPLAKEEDFGTVGLVDAGSKGTFYLMCCHLVSFQLTNEEITVFSERPDNKQQVEQYGKSIVAKLKAAYEKRSVQASAMLEVIPNNCIPFVMCGDFNDTPLSYTYHLIHSAGFTDGFVKSGRGVGHTYAGQLPLLRIDYVWGNEQVEPMAFKRLKVKGSDHYPVMMDFNVRHGL